MRQNLGWAIGYNAIALPIAAGVFEPAFGLVLRPEIAALSMSGSSLLVAVNALLLKRLRLPAPRDSEWNVTRAAAPQPARRKWHEETDRTRRYEGSRHPMAPAWVPRFEEGFQCCPE